MLEFSLLLTSFVTLGELFILIYHLVINMTHGNHPHTTTNVAIFTKIIKQIQFLNSGNGKIEHE